MKTVQLAIVGGGPAGLAAAAAAYDAGLRDILILERSGELGGILNQCIHAGFGLHTFHQELTGPEYAQRYIDAVRERSIPAWTDCMVLDISPEKVLTVTGRTVGLRQIRAQAVVLAMGCRERPRGALNIAGTRPAGIWSAGTAQRMVNMEGYLPGRQVVILGSGDIGLIMARRMTLEGAEVKAVAEVMPYSGGLKRNIVQCLDDFHIPLYLSTTVVEIHGQEHLTGVTLAQVDGQRLPIPGTERYIPCDTLLLSVGLLPENELTRQAGAVLDAVTGGPVVDETLATSLPGVFACGNVLHVHDLVDFVLAGGGGSGTQRRPVRAGGSRRRREHPSGGEERRALHRASVPAPGRRACHRPVPGGAALPQRGAVRLRRGHAAQAHPQAHPDPRRDGELSHRPRRYPHRCGHRDICGRGGTGTMKQELICIGCPMGCQLTAEVENGAVTTVTGNTCPRGAAYARKECVAPVRTVTGTVAIQGAALPVLPVRTNGEVPKALVFDVARALGTVTVQAPAAIGDVVLRDVCGTGVDVTAAKNMEKI